jgi:N-acetylneuraminic acid mutarotase
MAGRRVTIGRGLRLTGAAILLGGLLALSAGGWASKGDGAPSASAIQPAAGFGAGAAATERWLPLRAAGLERTEVGAARIGRSIYVVGGFVAPSRTTAAVERYDIRRNRWRRLPPMPIAVNHPAVASHRGFLYVYGGYTDSSFRPVTAALQRYDPRRRSWSLLRASRTPRAAAALAARGGRLFAVGGAIGGRALSTLEIYDVAAGRWRTAPPMRVAREHIAAVATGAGVYVFGGRSGADNLDAVERYDPRPGRWARLPSLRQARSGIAAAVVRGRPVVFGGEELTPGGTTIRPVELFDPAQRRWRPLPGMRTPRHGLGGAALGRRIYALQGGPTPGFAFSGVVEFLDVPRRMLR